MYSTRTRLSMTFFLKHGSRGRQNRRKLPKNLNTHHFRILLKTKRYSERLYTEENLHQLFSCLKPGSYRPMPFLTSVEYFSKYGISKKGISVFSRCEDRIFLIKNSIYSHANPNGPHEISIQ